MATGSDSFHQPDVLEWHRQIETVSAEANYAWKNGKPRNSIDAISFKMNDITPLHRLENLMTGWAARDRPFSRSCDLLPVRYGQPVQWVFSCHAIAISA